MFRFKIFHHMEKLPLPVKAAAFEPMLGNFRLRAGQDVYHALTQDLGFITSSMNVSPAL